MNTKQATMKDIAKITGVSITTVSHVINKTRHVNSETRELVLQAMNQLDYNPNRGKWKSNKSSGLIGVIIADIREDYYVSLVKAIETTATENKYSIIFCDSEMDHIKEKKNIKTILEKNISGLIIAPIDSHHYPAELKNLDIPIVLVDRQYDTHNKTFVGINNYESGITATRYLKDKGCKHIGFIGHSEHIYSVHKRIMGYKSVIYESQDTHEPSVLYIRYDKEDSYSLIKDFITKHTFDGLICATSDVCYEAISVIDDMSFSIPEEIKVITYDDNKWLDYLKYPVSVITQPTVEIGNFAVERVLQYITNPSDNNHVKTEVFFDTQIIDRLSGYKQKRTTNSETSTEVNSS